MKDVKFIQLNGTETPTVTETGIVLRGLSTIHVFEFPNASALELFLFNLGRASRESVEAHKDVAHIEALSAGGELHIQKPL